MSLSVFKCRLCLQVLVKFVTKMAVNLLHESFRTEQVHTIII